MRHYIIIGCAFLLFATDPVAAQVRPRKVIPRQELERQFRERGEQRVRRELNLNDTQMGRLREVNGHLATRRLALAKQARDLNSALRAELARGPAADQGHIAQLNGRRSELQRRHFELQQDEQRQLATFLTPMQQAKYLGLQAQLRQRVKEFRKQQGEAEGISDAP